MDAKIGYGITIILSMLVGFGGQTYLSQDQLDHSYFCTANNKVMLFDKLSSTGKTGYYTINTTQKSVTCTNGQWIKLADYAKSQGIDPNTLLEQSQSISSTAGQEVASGLNADSICDPPEMGGCRSVR